MILNLLNYTVLHGNLMEVSSLTLEMSLKFFKRKPQDGTTA